MIINLLGSYKRVPLNVFELLTPEMREQIKQHFSAWRAKQSPASEEDIAEVQRQLAACANDPNLTIVTHAWDLTVTEINRQEAILRLQKAGLVDENGEPAEPYREGDENHWIAHLK